MAQPATIQWRTVRPTPPSGVPDAATLLHAAMTATGALESFIADAERSGGPLVLLVNDPQRATQSGAAAVALARFLKPRAPRLRLRVLISTGTHAFAGATRARIESDLLTPLAPRADGVEWHDAESDRLVPAGGVRMHRWVADCRYFLPIGSIEPHYFAGVTGAHKTATIGVMARADIERNHAGALDAASAPLALDGNPVFDGIAAILAALEREGKRICAFNQVVAGSQIVDAAVGGWRSALDALLPTVSRLFVHSLPRPVDLLHLRVPSPLGRSFYQADKALKNCAAAVRDGGIVLLDAACEDGIGQDAFMKLLRAAPTAAAAREIIGRRGYQLGDHKAVKLRDLTDAAGRGVRVALLARTVSAEEARIAGMSRFNTLLEALQWVRGSTGSGPQYGVRVEDAGNMIVRTAAH